MTEREAVNTRTAAHHQVDELARCLRDIVNSGEDGEKFAGTIVNCLMTSIKGDGNSDNIERIHSIKAGTGSMKDAIATMGD